MSLPSAKAGTDSLTRESTGDSVTLGACAASVVIAWQ